MAAPGMIGAVGGGGLERPAEIGLREGRHILRDAQLLGRRVESRDRLAQLRIERVVRLELAGVGVESAQRAEENLPAHPQVAGHLDDLRHLLQLLRQRACRETAS